MTPLSAPRTRYAILDMLLATCRQQRLPLLACRSMGYYIPKTNGKRLVHALCPLGKDFMRELFSPTTRVTRGWSYGGYAKRRRDGGYNAAVSVEGEAPRIPRLPPRSFTRHP